MSMRIEGPLTRHVCGENYMAWVILTFTVISLVYSTSVTGVLRAVISLAFNKCSTVVQIMYDFINYLFNAACISLILESMSTRSHSTRKLMAILLPWYWQQSESVASIEISHLL